MGFAVLQTKIGGLPKKGNAAPSTSIKAMPELVWLC
jgi:hypothetical protein